MYIAIMAGGSGTRFWPASRRRKPKQLLKIAGDRPMIRMTFDRIKSFVPDENVLLLIGKAHEKETAGLFEDTKVQILTEPVGRNTAPCMGLAAFHVRHVLGRNDPIVFLPADHYIPETDKFYRAIDEGARVAAKGGIVVLGIVPAGPSTGYGYIHRGNEKTERDVSEAYEVLAFTEKPDTDTAGEYIKTGEYYWNAGIFIATPDILLGEISRQLPRLAGGLKKLEEVKDRTDFDRLLEKVYPGVENISFDYGVMENTGVEVTVLPAYFKWSDVGSWESLYDLLAEDRDEHGNLLEGNGLFVDCTSSFISSGGKRVVVCLGTKDCLVVDTEDVLLVADLKKSQDVKKIIDRLKIMKKEELL